MKKWLPWAIAAVPAVLGAAASLWLNLSHTAADPILQVRADLGTIFLIWGGSITLIGEMGWAFYQYEKSLVAETQRQANEDRRRFLRRLDHELKNPLTAILAGLANVSNCGPENAGALESVSAQVQRLSRLVADLRKLSDLEVRPIEISPVNLVEVLEEVYEIAQERAESSGAQVHLSVPRAPWPLPSVPGDRDLLFLAVHNLVDNSLKFTPAGGTVEIRALEEGDHIMLEIADTGQGIPAAEIPHVWEELYRGEGARGTPGSGLGLALVRAIILRHKGQINLRSRPGQGTVITLRLPVNK